MLTTRNIVVDWCLLVLLQIADETAVSVEDREKMQSVEIMVANPRIFSLFNLQFVKLRWLQCLTAGKKTVYQVVDLVFYVISDYCVVCFVLHHSVHAAW